MTRPAHSPRALAAVVAAGCLLGCTRLGSLDLPLMLANGERILGAGTIPRTNVFSWVNADHAYLNDKWLFMVLVAAVERVGGTLGLGLLKMVFGGALGALLLALSRRHLPPWRAAGVSCLALTMLSYRLHLRAEWLSSIGAATTLLLLPGVLEGRRRDVALQVAMMPVWAACHGYWVLGPLLLGAASLGARSSRGAVTALACVAAAAVSPYGLANVVHPLRVLSQVGGPLSDAITELREPFTGGAPVTFFHAVAVALTVLALAALYREARARRTGHALVLALLVAVSWRLDRNLALLGLTVPLAVDAFPASGGRAAWGGLLAAVAVAGTAAGVPRIAVDRAFGVGEHPGRFPVALVDGLPGAWRDERYVNDLSVGSWLVRRRGTAFIDGNTEGYPPPFLLRYRAILSGETSAGALDDELRPDGWLLRTSGGHTRLLVLWLFLSGRYAPARWDDVGTLFRHDLVPEEAEARWRTWLRDVYLPLARPWFPAGEDALAAAREALPAGAADDPVALLRGALELAPWEPALYRKLADAYAARGDHANAARCRVWAERIDPR